MVRSSCLALIYFWMFFFFFQAEDGIRDLTVTGVQTCALPISQLLKTKLAEHTKNVIRPHFENLVAQLTEKPPKPITISDDGERLFIPYPSRFGTTESVFLEFGGRNVISPNEELPLRPYIAAELPKLQFPEATVRVLIPSRTFWEKATLIHVACNRSEDRKSVV